MNSSSNNNNNRPSNRYPTNDELKARLILLEKRGKAIRANLRNEGEGWMYRGRQVVLEDLRLEYRAIRRQLRANISFARKAS